MTSSSLAAALREPHHQVSPRAKSYWRTGALIQLAFVAIALGVSYIFWTDRPWWAHLLGVLLVLLEIIPVVVMPGLRFRIHRWEMTEEAVFTRSGWLTRVQRIAPLSRVQTVDSHQGALMRAFRLMSVTVTTASAAGPISIECLDVQVARSLVFDLTERTSADQGDAT